MNGTARSVGVPFAVSRRDTTVQYAGASPDVADPFKLFFRLMLACFKIAGYFFACGVQSLWYLAHGKPELVGDAIGYFGRDVTNTLADLFRGK
jgi:hypothetical protein